MSRILMQVGESERPLRLGRGSSEPLQNSAAASWHGVQFEVHRLGPAEDVGRSGPIPGELGLMIVTEGSYRTTLRGPLGDRAVRSEAGDVHLLSGDQRPDVLEVDGDAEVVALRLTPAWLAYFPFEGGAPRYQEPLAAGHTGHTLVAAMREEVAAGCRTGRLYAESLSLSLLAYLFRGQLADAGSQQRCVRLSPTQRRRLMGYIHEHLDRSLGVDMLAAVLDMTPRQLTLRFRNTFGTTPHRYVQRARLDKGARLLASRRHDIAEVALRVGFCNQSHFTTAFRKLYGETPWRYARARRTQ